MYIVTAEVPAAIELPHDVAAIGPSYTSAWRVAVLMWTSHSAASCSLAGRLARLSAGGQLPPLPSTLRARTLMSARRFRRSKSPLSMSPFLPVVPI